MNLRDSDQWFSQRYGNLCEVHTQQPPVDMCCLISANDTNGVSITDGFQYSIQTATDYVMQYLEAVPVENLPGTAAHSLLPNIQQVLEGLPPIIKAKRNYYVIGNCNVTAPKNQVLTYLAIGFYEKFWQQIQTNADAGKEETVSGLSKTLQFDESALYCCLMASLPQLQLP